MQDILAELAAAFDDCSEWAGGTECRQTLDGQTRYYNMNDLCTVLQWLNAAAHGQPLTAAQEQAARRVIAFTRWHDPAQERGKGGLNLYDMNV